MNRVALITGGGRGIGLGISKALLVEDFDVAFCGVREATKVTSIGELESTGRRIVYVQADVSREADRARLVEETLSAFGRIDVLVNNAGVAPKERADLLDATQQSYEYVMDVNLKGPYFLTQRVARIMRDQDSVDGVRGTIVFITSISSTVPSVNRGEYCVSKAGLSMVVKLWSARLAEFEIPVYEVRPGITMTDMTAGVTAKYDALIAEGLLLQRRWGSPDDVGKAVAMLACGDLPYSTGQVINVDGGFTRNVL